MRATPKITCLSAITFAFGEVLSSSIINFRLCGEHLLSLHDESRQRRAKEGEDNRSERFSSPSFESLSSFDRTRFASAHKCAGGLQIRYFSVVRAQLGFETLTPREIVYALENISASGANRGFASGRCPSRLFFHALRGGKRIVRII